MPQSNTRTAAPGSAAQSPSVITIPFDRSPAPSIGPPWFATNVCAVIGMPTSTLHGGITNGVDQVPVPLVKPAAYGAEFGRSTCTVHDPNGCGAGGPKL